MDTLDDHSDSTLLLLAAVVVVIVCSASDMPRNYPYRLPIRIPPGNFDLDELDNGYCRRLIISLKKRSGHLLSPLRSTRSLTFYDSSLVQKQHFASLCAFPGLND